MGDLETRLSAAEQEKYRTKAEERELREQIRQSERAANEAELAFEARKSKLEHETALVSQERVQLAQEVKTLERKVAAGKKEEDRWLEEERKLRKEMSRLNFANEELTEKVNYWKSKYTTAERMRNDRGSKDSSRDTLKLNRLAEIEQKLDTLAVLQKNVTGAVVASSGSKKSRRRHEPEVPAEELVDEAEPEQPQEVPEQEPEAEAEAEEDQPKSGTAAENEAQAEAEGEGEAEGQQEEGNEEEMLRNLTAQILEKDELKNANIVKYFKLDQIQLHDKDNEYKNLLKAMGALYFANRYSKMVPALFSHWKEQLVGRLQAENQDDAEEQEEEAQTDSNQLRLRADTESDPGPINYDDVEQQQQQTQEEEEGKPEVEVDTELANQEAEGSQPAGDSKDSGENPLKIVRKSGQDENDEIHVDDNLAGGDDDEEMEENFQPGLEDEPHDRPRAKSADHEDEQAYLNAPLDEAEPEQQDYGM